MGLKVGEDGRARVDDEAWWAEKNNKGRERLSRTIQEMPQVLRALGSCFGQYEMHTVPGHSTAGPE
jgi:hypothetical protein